jgi:hypothetical protein
VRDETRKPGGHLLYDVLWVAGTALLVLKLTGVITWSWWWVLTPLWINIALAPLVIGGWILSARHWFKSRERLLGDLFASK